nr:Gal-binding and CUB domains containing receptor 4 [Arenicola marina]
MGVGERAAGVWTPLVAVWLLHQSLSCAGLFQEVCLGENVDISCDDGQVIQVISARYGRMQLGACVRADLGYLGCSVDVTRLADDWCSGRQTCTQQVAKAVMEAAVGSPCFEELVTYLDIRYECLQVNFAGGQICSPATHPPLHVGRGVLSSYVADEYGCGTPQVPWSVDTHAGQRVNISLTNYHWSTLGGAAEDAPATSCDVIGFVVERSLGINRTLCAGSTKHSHLYTSMSSSVEIGLIPVDLRQAKNNFVVTYTVLGCPDITPPANAWYKREANSIEIGCNENHNSWNLVCSGNKWDGVVGNCSEWVASESDSTETLFNLSPVVIVSLIGGLAFATLLLIIALIVGCVCMRKRTPRTPPRRPSASNKYVVASAGGGICDPRTLYRPGSEADLIEFGTNSSTLGSNPYPGQVVYQPRHGAPSTYNPQQTLYYHVPQGQGQGQGQSQGPGPGPGHSLRQPRVAQAYCTCGPGHPVMPPPQARPPPPPGAPGMSSTPRTPGTPLMPGTPASCRIQARPLPDPDNPYSSTEPAVGNAREPPPPGDAAAVESEYAALNCLPAPNDQETWRVRPADPDDNTDMDRLSQEGGLSGEEDGDPGGEDSDSSASDYYWQGTRKYHVLEKDQALISDSDV